jgi:DsbC/DsbD-like thiol-disulfide interchange protein
MKRLLLFCLLLLAGPALAQPDPGPKVAARLVAEDVAVAPGGTVTVALEEKIADGWHTYWKNPGDAGGLEGRCDPVAAPQAAAGRAADGLRL